MSCSELLRRRQEALPKVIAPRPIRDASQLTEMRKFAACAGRPAGVRSDGSSVLPSSESYLYAKAGCSVCLSPKQETIVVAGCCSPPEPPTQLALQGSMPCPCPGSYVTAQLASRECCTSPGNSRTWLANDMPPNFVAPPPPCSHPPRCPPQGPPEIVCSAAPIAKQGLLQYWQTAQAATQAPTLPCSNCNTV